MDNSSFTFCRRVQSPEQEAQQKHTAGACHDTGMYLQHFWADVFLTSEAPQLIKYPTSVESHVHLQ